MRIVLCFATALALISSAQAEDKKSIAKKPKAAPAAAQMQGIEVAFSPSPDNAAEVLVIKAIDKAGTSVVMAAYHLTSLPVANALCAASAKGLAVSIVLDAKDNRKGNKESQRDKLEACGVAVRTNDHYPIMNNKFIVVDDKVTELGSYNFGANEALKNAEGATVVWNNKALATRYATEFDRLFGEGDAK